MKKREGENRHTESNFRSRDSSKILGKPCLYVGRDLANSIKIYLRKKPQGTPEDVVH